MVRSIDRLPLRRPTPIEFFRWVPRQGKPRCIAEWASQALVRFLAFLPVYIAVVVSIILVIVIWHPFGLGRLGVG